jgi:hypothetical protein
MFALKKKLDAIVFILYGFTLLKSDVSEGEGRKIQAQ